MDNASCHVCDSRVEFLIDYIDRIKYPFIYITAFDIPKCFAAGFHTVDLLAGSRPS